MVMTMRVVVMGVGVGVGAHFARILLELLARRVELDAHTIGGLRQAQHLLPLHLRATCRSRLCARAFMTCVDELTERETSTVLYVWS